MIDALLADGIASGVGERIATLAVKCLAVAGGFLVGYFLGAAIAWALDRWVFAQKAPGPLKKAVSMVAGVALAILVALIVFGEGGAGLFGGGGGDGKGTPNTEDKGKGKATPAPTPEPKKDDVTPKPVDPATPSKPADVVVRVTVLGGNDVPNNDEKYYLIDDDTDRKNLTQLGDIVTARKEKSKGTVGIVIQFRSTNRPTLNPEHESIHKLRSWAEKAKVDVTFPAPR